ncbi:MAG: GHMP kinase [Spirochaetia bacterium]|nr:GHMP kinase [Spirochaetia bacterium]
MPCIKVSAPGSLMLTGEHAVLHGSPAAACAVDKRIYLILTPREDREIHIESPLGNLETTLDTLPEESQFKFIIEAIRQSSISIGLDIRTESEFSSTVGLGSSAAVTVCTCMALNTIKGSIPTREELFSQCYSVVHGVQKTGSGCDLAASIYGGIIAMESKDSHYTPRKLDCPSLPEIDLYYCGYKMKTPDVIALVNQKAQAEPEKYAKLYQYMTQVAGSTITLLERGNFDMAGNLFGKYQMLMEQLGVCDDTLKDMVTQLQDDSNVLGAKISGSGLGDCVLSLGIPSKKLEGYQNIPVKISDRGACPC